MASPLCENAAYEGVTRAAIAALLLVVAVCVLVWMLGGPNVSDAVVDKANVVGGIAGLLALVLAFVLVVAPRLRGADPQDLAATMSAQAVADHLAEETLRYWEDQAKARRITTPSPVMVRWCWASDDVAVSPAELPSRAEVLTDGVVTQLREQLFDRLGAERARVVLLGQAGAGKTAAMLLLLIDILKQRAGDSCGPVPVWLTLGGWNPETTGLPDWAEATLIRDYPGLAASAHGRSGTVAQQLIRSRRVALFLDGLDEMPPAAWGVALEAIDHDATELPVVLTSRPDQYRTALDQGRLYGAAVVELLPVEVEQAERFLLAEQLGQRRHAWQQVIDDLRTHPDHPAALVLTTPLALSLARDTYSDSIANPGKPTDLIDTKRYPDSDALMGGLLARSLTLAYPDPSQRAHAIYWLSWIARRLGSNRDLCWWDIPTWSPPWHRALAGGLTVWPAFLLTLMLAGLAGGVAGLRVVGLAGVLAVGLAFGLVLGLAAGLMDKGAAPHGVTLRWPTHKEWRDMLTGGRLAIGLSLVLSFVLAFGLTPGLAGGLAVGLSFVPALGLAKAWNTPLATVRVARPLEVYRADRRRTMIFGLAVVLSFVLAVVLVGGLAAGLVGVLVVYLATGLSNGLGPALRLAMAEVVWGLRFKRVRFMALLQTALDRQMLRQAGTVYQFRHVDFQDYLATQGHHPVITTPAAEPRLTSKPTTRR